MCPADKTDALVLKTSPYSETSLLVWLLTPCGVVRVMAKGARRSRRQPQAVYETFAWIRATLSIRDPESLGNMIAPELVRDWPFLRDDIDRFAYAGAALETLWAVADQSPPDPWFFTQACIYLDALESLPGPGSLTSALLLGLLIQSGFPPQLAESWTDETLPKQLAYDFSSGRIEAAPGAQFLHAMPLTDAMLRPLLPWLGTPPPLDGSLVLRGVAGPGVLRWLLRVWEDHLSRRLRSVDFLERMVLDKSR